MAEIRGFRGDMTEDIKQVKEDVNKHTTEIQEMRERQEQLEKHNTALSEKITQLQDYNRRNNLIVGGVPEEPGNESWDMTEEKVKNILIVDLGLNQQVVDRLSIEKAHRLGRRKHGENCRVIKLQFANFKDKEKVLKKAREVKCDKPYFREDFSAEVLDARAKLKPGLIAAREGGLQAFLSNDKLIVQKQEKKNVYRYDRQSKEVVPLSHTFNDNLKWNTVESDR